MDTNEQLEALKDIRNMMNRSVRFVSFSGLSGVFAGTFALTAVYIVYNYFGKTLFIESYSDKDILFFIPLAIATLILSLLTAFIFTKRKAKKDGVSMWDATAKTAMINLLLPLITGGFFCLALMKSGNIGWLAPSTLIFYGLALINASKHTFPTIRSLGIIEVVLGIISSFFIGYGLIFWAVGFGFMHIGYGIYMYFKYDRV